MPVEPVSITLAALALLDPAIRSVRKAYGVYKLTTVFGQHYAGIQRRIDAEQARLEVAINTDLDPLPSKEIITQIERHLGHLRKHFQACQDLIISIDRHTDLDVNSTGTEATAVTSPDSNGLTADDVPQRSKLKAFFSRKHHKASKRNKSISRLASSSNRERVSIRDGSRVESSTTNSSANITTLYTTPGTSASILDRPEVLEATTRQGITAKHLQSSATILMKAKWIGQKKDFEKHLQEIRASNDFIRDIVSMRALGSIHNILLIPEYKGEVPKEVSLVQGSLDQLHNALSLSNQGSEGHKPAIISIRVMTAAAYLRLRRRVEVQHDYLKLRSESIVYPLHIQSVGADSSTVVLAETLMGARESSTPPASLDTVVPLSEMLSGQSMDAIEAFKDIGWIVHDRDSSAFHHLFEDISKSWTVQDTLAGLIKSTAKFQTFIHLAVQVSISYMYFASVGAKHHYPRLDDYLYYKEALTSDSNLNQQNVLEPFLSVGFGSRPPRKSTMNIGGASVHSSRDEAMFSLGLLLHEIGCWKLLDEGYRNSEVIKDRRKDLQISAGIPYTQIVDACFAAKEGEWEPAAHAAMIYRKVVAPLEKLVSELRWD